MTVETATYRTLTTVDDVRGLVHVLPEYVDHEDELIHRLADSRCILKGHFHLLSGQHSDYFLRFRSFASIQANVDMVAGLLAERMRAAGRIDALLAPETAGSILARSLVERIDAPASLVLLPIDGDGHPLPHVEKGLLRPGERVVIVNDLVTAGRGLNVLVSAARETGAIVVGVALFANRNPDGPLTAIADAQFPEYHILNLEADHFGPDGGPTSIKNCDLCKRSTEDIVLSQDLN